MAQASVISIRLLLSSKSSILPTMLSNRSSLAGYALIGRRAYQRRTKRLIAWSAPTHKLITPIQLNLHCFTNLQCTHCGPDTSLTLQCPFCYTFVRRMLEQIEQISE